MSDGPDGPEGELHRLEAEVVAARERQMHADAGSTEWEQAAAAIRFAEQELARLTKRSSAEPSPP